MSMSSSEMLGLTITELTQGFRNAEISPVESMRATLEQIRRMEPLVNAFVARAEEDDLLRQAEQSAARWAAGRPAGPLDGVPMVVKDAILCKGWPNRLGSLLTSTAINEEDAPAVARVREAGALLLGKTTTPEFGWKGVTDSPLSGITRNPWDLRLTPGGSSGGAAAAVAAGMGYGAVGTDAGGSVRIPAAYTGLVGLKATRGRIAAYPPSALWTLGHIGPMARDTRDVALLLRVMGRTDPRDWNALPDEDVDYVAGLDRVDPKGLRIAYSPDFGHARVDPRVAQAAHRAADALANLGAQVTEISAPLPDAREHFSNYFAAGLSHSVRLFDDAARRKLDPGLQELLRRHESDTREQFLSAYDFQIRLTREARLLHTRYDFLLSPTMVTPPFEAGAAAPAGYDAANWLDWSPFTYPFNLTGQPALSLPCGQTADGLPLAVQLVGGLYDDARLLGLAHALERVLTPRHLLAPCVQQPA